MARGDHIRVFRGFYWHHGIDCGDGTVIHYTGTPLNMHEASIERAPREEFVDEGLVEVVRHEKVYPPEVTVERAESRLDEKQYSLAFNNCEHFATWCRTGEHQSRQVDIVTKVGRVVIGPEVELIRRVGEWWKEPDEDIDIPGPIQFETDKAGPESPDTDSTTDENPTKPDDDPDDGPLEPLPPDLLQPTVLRDDHSVGDDILDHLDRQEIDVLGSANLAVGVVNLGFGIFNTYQNHLICKGIQRNRHITRQEADKTRREVGQVKEALVAGFEQVEELLEYQHGLLHAVREAQETHGRQLEAIMRGMMEGFESIEARIQSVIEKRREDEYRDRLNKLEITKRDVAEALEFCDELPDSEREALDTRAKEFQSWLKGRLESSDLHILERQPIVFAQIEARMARVDALMFEAPEQNIERARHRIVEMRQNIRDEVRCLHEVATPWEVATILRDPIRYYGTLHRSLSESREVLGEVESLEEDIHVPPWPDPLPPTPDPEEGDPLDEPIEIQSLEDYTWFVRAFERDPSEDISDLEALSPEVLEHRLGADTLVGAPDDLRPLLLPETWEHYRQSIEEEFDIEPDIDLQEIDSESADLDVQSISGVYRARGGELEKSTTEEGIERVSAVLNQLNEKLDQVGAEHEGGRSYDGLVERTRLADRLRTYLRSRQRFRESLNKLPDWSSLGSENDGNNPKDSESLSVEEIASRSRDVWEDEHGAYEQIWEVQEPELICEFKHDSKIYSADIGPNSEWIAFASSDGKAYLHSIDDDDRIVLDGHLESVRTIDIAPSGEQVVTGSEDSTICLWSMEGELRETLSMQESHRIIEISHPPNNDKFVAISSDTRVSTVDDYFVHVFSYDGQIINELKYGVDRVSALFTDPSIAFHPEGDKFAILQQKDKITLRSESGKILRSISIDDVLSDDVSCGFEDMAFHPSGNRLNAIVDNGTIQVWPIDSGGIRKIATKEKPRSIDIHPVGDIVATVNDVNWEPEIVLIKGKKNVVIRTNNNLNLSMTGSIIFDSSGRYLVTASSSRNDLGMIQIWNIEPVVESLQCPDDVVDSGREDITLRFVERYDALTSYFRRMNFLETSKQNDHLDLKPGAHERRDLDDLFRALDNLEGRGELTIAEPGEKAPEDIPSTLTESNLDGERLERTLRWLENTME